MYLVCTQLFFSSPHPFFPLRQERRRRKNDNNERIKKRKIEEVGKFSLLVAKDPTATERPSRARSPVKTTKPEIGSQASYCLRDPPQCKCKSDHLPPLPSEKLMKKGKR